MPCLIVSTKDCRDLRRHPLTNRSATLEEVVDHGAGRLSTVFVSARLSENGLTAYQVTKEKATKACSPGVHPRPASKDDRPYWQKFKVHQEDEFVIVGYTPPAGSRESFGALLLAARDRGRPVYVGKVGTGFARERLAELHWKFQPLIRYKPLLIEIPRASVT